MLNCAIQHNPGNTCNQLPSGKTCVEGLYTNLYIYSPKTTLEMHIYI